MNWDAVGAIAEFAGALAVIITLIYLSYQLRQSNQIAKAEAIREVTNTYGFHTEHLHTPGLNDLSVRGFADFEGLTAEEKAKFNGYYYPLLNHIETVFEMNGLKLVPPHQYSAWMAAAIMLIVTPGGAQWWTHSQKTLSKVFVDEVNRLLQDESVKKIPWTELWPWTGSEEVGEV